MNVTYGGFGTSFKTRQIGGGFCKNQLTLCSGNEFYFTPFRLSQTRPAPAQSCTMHAPCPPFTVLSSLNAIPPENTLAQNLATAACEV